MLTEQDYTAAAERHLDMVYRVALNWLRSPADAEDAAQNAMLRLWRTDTAFQSGEHLRRWLVKVTVNECKSLWRTLWRRRVSLQDITDEHLPPAFDEPDHERLYDALAALPEKCRIVVHLFYFEGYGTREIAGILGVREPTVRTRLSRARKILRQQLREAWEDEQPDRIPGNEVPSHDGRGSCPC